MEISINKEIKKTNSIESKQNWWKANVTKYARAIRIIRIISKIKYKYMNENIGFESNVYDIQHYDLQRHISEKSTKFELKHFVLILQ